MSSPPASDQPTSSTTSSSDAFSIVVSDAAEKGLAEYLKDVEYAEGLVQWLHEETNISRTILRIAVKVFAHLVTGVVNRGGAWVGTGSAILARKLFQTLPGHERISSAFQSLVEHLVREKAAKREFGEWLNARPRAGRDGLRQYLTLDLRAARESLEALEEIRDLLSPQPELDIPLEPLTRESRFLFAARKTRLVGRETHLAELDAFLSVDQPFAWWAMAGPGGAGKSRLALEMCLRLGAAWRMGYLRNRDFVWASWRPAQPTTVIVDYADEQVEQIGMMVEELQRRAECGELEFPVRVLLLVREADPDWQRALFGSGVRRSRVERANHGFALQVDPLAEDDLWTVLTAFLEDGKQQPERAETLERLNNIDPRGRPLFAAFAGDAISRGRNLRAWDEQALVRDVLDRERSHWRRNFPPGETRVRRKYENLLALATLAGGLDIGDVAELEVGLFPSTVAEFEQEIYRAMSGGPASRFLEPLTPDLLGELFVLEYLDPERGVDPRLTTVLREAAWDLRPGGMQSFLMRAAADFPRHPALRALSLPPDAHGDRRSAWSGAAYSMIVSGFLVRDIAELRALYDVLVEVSQNFPAEEELRGRRGHAANVLMGAYLHLGDSGAAKTVYGELVALAAAYPADAALRSARAMATHGYLSFGGRICGNEEGEDCYAGLVRLSQEHPEDSFVREYLAWTACYFVQCHGKLMQMREARRFFDDVMELAGARPFEQPLQFWAAQAAADLAETYSRGGLPGEGCALYVELARRARADSDAKMLRAACGRIAYSMAVAYVNRIEPENARVIYDELAALSEAFPTEAPIRGARAEIALILLVGYLYRKEDPVTSLTRPPEPLPQHQLDGSSAMYEELMRMEELYPDDPAVRKVLDDTRTITAFLSDPHPT